MPKRKSNRKGKNKVIRNYPTVSVIRHSRRKRTQQKPNNIYKTPIRQPLKKKPIQVVKIAGQRGVKSGRSSIELLKKLTNKLVVCKQRKLYKKQMLKKIASQVKSNGGNMENWRKKRSKNRKQSWEC